MLQNVSCFSSTYTPDDRQIFLHSHLQRHQDRDYHLFRHLAHFIHQVLGSCAQGLVVLVQPCARFLNQTTNLPESIPLRRIGREGRRVRRYRCGRWRGLALGSGQHLLHLLLSFGHCSVGIAWRLFSFFHLFDDTPFPFVTQEHIQLCGVESIKRTRTAEHETLPC